MSNYVYILASLEINTSILKALQSVGRLFGEKSGEDQIKQMINSSLTLFYTLYMPPFYKRKHN
ncbi:MAG: hypothetical protein DRQ62_15135 [Gammaproteobacteria bacterium]|nr:MAG: hypothetical protein DRQ62_15135 [Gammaproteobacteria bacterium]